MKSTQYIQTIKKREQLIKQLADIEKKLITYKYKSAKKNITKISTTISIKSKIKTIEGNINSKVKYWY